MKQIYFSGYAFSCSYFIERFWTQLLNDKLIDTGNIEHITQNEEKQNKNATQTTKTMSNTIDYINKPGVNPCTREG
jgi:hypothetical protein